MKVAVTWPASSNVASVAGGFSIAMLIVYRRVDWFPSSEISNLYRESVGN
jgi:hypothetical protein